MKKLLALLTAAILLLAGCSSESTDMAEQQTAETLNILLPFNPSDQNGTQMDIVLEEATGQDVQFDLLPADDASTKVQMLLSSDSGYHMMQLYPYDFTQAAQNGALLDLTPYLEAYGQDILAAYPQEFWDAVSDPETGAIYGIPVIAMTENITSTIYVRTDILEQYGYAMPTTTEELKNVTCGLAADGMQTPYANTYKMWSNYTIRGAFGVSWDWNIDPETGQYIHISQDPRWDEYVQYEASLYECGAYGNDYETITYDDAVQRFINGDAAFVAINSWDIPNIAAALAEQGLDYTEMTDIIPVIAGPDGHMEAPTMGTSITAILTIPANMEQYAQQSITWLNSTFDPAVQAEYFLGGAPYDAETNPTGSYTVQEDGTISIYDESGNIYPTPAPYMDANLPVSYDIRAARAELESVNREAEGQQENLPPEKSESWYQAKITPYNQYAVPNPLGLALFTPEYAKVMNQLVSATYDWAELTIAGQSPQSFEELSASIASQYNIEVVTDEINTVTGKK